MDQLNLFPNMNTEVFSKLTSAELLETNKYLLTFDLTNELLIKKDKVLYSEEFVECINEMDFKDYVFAYFLKLEISVETYLASFKPIHDEGTYHCTLIPLDEYKQMVHKDDCYKATVYYVEGSIKQKVYYIKWSNKCESIRESHVELPLVSSKKEMSTLLNGVLEEVNIKAFHVLDVGQGSSNIINYENGEGEEKYLFYDIGISLHSTRDPDYSRYMGLYESISFDIFNTLIISHWHEDHFLGIFLDQSGELFKKTWVVTECSGTWNAKRLCYINSLCGNLMMIDNGLTGLLYENTNLSIYKGEQPKKKSIGYRNGSGLYLYFKKGSDNLLALGDVPYDYAQSLLTKSNSRSLKVDTLIVPNHGSILQGNFIEPRLSMKTAGFDISNAVISAGVTSSQHPNYETLSELFAKGFNTLRTDVECKVFNEKDITIEF